MLGSSIIPRGFESHTVLQISVVAQLVELWYIIYERMPPLVGRIVVTGSSPVNIKKELL